MFCLILLSIYLFTCNPFYLEAKLVSKQKLTKATEISNSVSRILVPSRVILPPQAPHYIYFQPIMNQPLSEETQHSLEPTYLSPNQTLAPPSPPYSCLQESAICGYEEHSYPHEQVSTVVQTFQSEVDRLVEIIKSKDLEVSTECPKKNRLGFHKDAPNLLHINLTQ